MDVMTSAYASPLGTITLAADERGLGGLWFDGQQHFGELGSAQRRLDTATNAGQRKTPPRSTQLTQRAHGLTPTLQDREPREPTATSSARHAIPTAHMAPSAGHQARHHDDLRCARAGIRRNVSERALLRAPSDRRSDAIPSPSSCPATACWGADGSLTGYAGGVERKAGAARVGTRISLTPQGGAYSTILLAFVHQIEASLATQSPAEKRKPECGRHDSKQPRPTMSHPRARATLTSEPLLGREPLWPRRIFLPPALLLMTTLRWALLTTGCLARLSSTSAAASTPASTSPGTPPPIATAFAGDVINRYT